jgi:hypothetical protein
LLSNKSEAFSRILIDKALEASDWDLLDSGQVRFEHNAVIGRADYLLLDGLGRTLCVLEAKREDLDPYDAKKQGKKAIEVRSWMTEYAGYLWLHTGKKSDGLALARFGLFDLFQGGFVGRITLDAIVPVDLERWQKWSSQHLVAGPFNPHSYAWIIIEPRPLLRPIPAPGDLHLFVPASHIQTELKRAGFE